MYTALTENDLSGLKSIFKKIVPKELRKISLTAKVLGTDKKKRVKAAPTATPTASPAATAVVAQPTAPTLTPPDFSQSPVSFAPSSGGGASAPALAPDATAPVDTGMSTTTMLLIGGVAVLALYLFTRKR